MTKPILQPFDPADYLTSEQDHQEFLAEAFATQDTEYIAHALGVAARAKGMAQIAQATGLSREQLYRSFSPAGNPKLKTMLAVMNALGLELSAKARDAA
jgi:probable addiction module antidote protein